MFSCDSIPKPLLSTLLDQVKHNAAELTETTHFNCEAVGSFALRHPSAQDEVGGPAQASQVVGEQDGVLCLGAHLDEELLLGLCSNNSNGEFHHHHP